MDLMERRMVAWGYDLFPYTLMGEAEFLEVKNDLTVTGYVPSYHSKFKIVFHTGLESGKEMKKELENLTAEYSKAEKELREEYQRKALKIAPFLRDNPNYKSIV